MAKANPRAIEIDSLGQPGVVLGTPNKLAMMTSDSQWRIFDVGVYPHSLAIGGAGKVWFYLVSLLPQTIVDELGLDLELRSRAVRSYTPVGDSGVLVHRSGEPGDFAADAD